MIDKAFMVLLEEEYGSLKDFEEGVRDALNDGWLLFSSGCSPNINRKPCHWVHLVWKTGLEK